MGLAHTSFQALLTETGLLQWLAPGSTELSRQVAGLLFLETAADCANVRENQVVLISGQAVRELTPAGLVARLADAGAAGLIARQPEAGLGSEAARHRLPLVLLPAGTPWSGVLERIQHCLDRARTRKPASASARDRLWELAEAISRTTGNPVTVEDPQFGIWAYSSQSGELDPVRVQTILSKRAPESVKTGFEQYGVMKTLHQARGPVRIEAIPAMGLNGTRVVTPIRFEGRLLGYIWVIESARRLNQEEMQTLSAAAVTAGAWLHEQQTERESESHRQEEFLHDLFEGRIGSEQEAAAQLQSLGLRLGPQCVALTVTLGAGAVAGVQDQAAACRAELERQKVPGIVAPHLSGVHVLAGCSAADAPGHLRTVAEALVRAVGGGDVCVGVGNPVRSMLEARQSLYQAQNSVTLGRSLWADRQVFQCEELGAYRLLAQMADPAALESRTHPVIQKLRQYDAENGTDLIRSLESYLDSAGNVGRASRALTIHSNTMLYRLQRMAEIAGFDPDDSGQRFVLELEFRLRRLFRGGV